MFLKTNCSLKTEFAITEIHCISKLRSHNIIPVLLMLLTTCLSKIFFFLLLDLPSLVLEIQVLRIISLVINSPLVIEILMILGNSATRSLTPKTYCSWLKPSSQVFFFFRFQIASHTIVLRQFSEKHNFWHKYIRIFYINNHNTLLNDTS